jgi:hypothetical protein
VTDGILSELRYAEATLKAQRMSRPEKEKYLRGHGWRRMSTTGSER